MTSRRTWSSASISNAVSRAFLLGAVLSLIGGGCATHSRPPAPPPVRGYVNLDILARRHPGWGGVGRYDAALSRLETAARSLPPADRSDQKIAVLPALPPALVQTVEVSSTDLSAASARLSSIQESLLGGLRSRREAARADQIASQQDNWRRAARQLYALPTGAAPTSPDLELQLLQANVETLTSTLNGWKESTLPAPKWEALRAKVEADHARLQALIAARTQARDAEKARQEAEVLRLREARIAYVRMQASMLESRLLAADDHYLAGQQARLTRQRDALLGALALPAPVGVAADGNAGAEALPKGRSAGRAALAQASLTAAEAHLTAQRARWVRHLYDDTLAAARDTAGQKNWDVTFGPPRPGDRDLTQPMTQAMRASVWRLPPG